MDTCSRQSLGHPSFRDRSLEPSADLRRHSEIPRGGLRRTSSRPEEFGRHLGRAAEHGDVLEAAVGERRPVVALGRREPANPAVQPVVVGVAGVRPSPPPQPRPGRACARGRGPRPAAAQNASTFPLVHGVSICARVDVPDAQLLERACARSGPPAGPRPGKPGPSRCRSRRSRYLSRA